MKKSRSFALPKEERLCSEKQISSLFTEGTSFFSYPFKVIWSKRVREPDIQVKVLLAVSKKNLKLSSQRNYVKRIMRESYRMNKFGLIDPLSIKEISINLGFVYVGKHNLTFKEMDIKIKEIINRLAKLEWV